MDARGPFELWDGFAIATEVKVHRSEILVTAEALWSQGDCLLVHGHRIVKAPATQIEIAQPIIILEIIRPKLNCIQKGLFGFVEIVFLLMGRGETAVKAVICRVEANCALVLFNGLFVFACSTEYHSKTRMA